MLQPVKIPVLQHHEGIDAKTPELVACEQQRRRPDCASTQSGHRAGLSLRPVFGTNTVLIFNRTTWRSRLHGVYKEHLPIILERGSGSSRERKKRNTICIAANYFTGIVHPGGGGGGVL